VIVYVQRKLREDQLAPGEVIPKQLDGVPTDVVVMDSAQDRQSDENEHRFIDYVKLHKEIVRASSRNVPVTSRDRDVGEVAIVEDDPNHSFLVPAHHDVDWVGAYQKFRLTHPDNYDFVTFWSDFEVDCRCGAFYCGLVNPTRGINWSACIAGGRAGWHSSRLQGFMYFIREDDAALLQEIGHHWMAYTGFRNQPGNARTSYEICLDNKPGHWSSYFDNIIRANGSRVPNAAKSPKAFTNAFVLLTRDAPSAVARAREIDRIRARMSEQFATATGYGMQLSTSL